MPWRDARRSAEHLDISEARFLALVKSGTLPRPSYHLGERSPRWNSDSLDRAMNPNSALDVTREAFDGLVKKIEEKGRAHRQENAR
jgi:predicted DNA-binding transcriptional regulator AlpA